MFNVKAYFFQMTILFLLKSVVFLRAMAQLIDSPTMYHIQPMQTDTKKRHYNG